MSYTRPRAVRHDFRSIESTGRHLIAHGHQLWRGVATIVWLAAGIAPLAYAVDLQPNDIEDCAFAAFPNSAYICKSLRDRGLLQKSTSQRSPGEGEVAAREAERHARISREWQQGKNARDAARRDAGLHDEDPLEACEMPEWRCDDLRDVAMKRARENAARVAQAAERALAAASPPPKVYRFDPPTPRGAHHWIWHEGGEFGYQRELSAHDRQLGIAAAPLFVVGYQGKQSGVYNFATADSQLLSCRTPCETIISLSAAAGRQVFPVSRGSLLWALVEDAKNGWLATGSVTTTDPNYKPEW